MTTEDGRVVFSRLMARARTRTQRSFLRSRSLSHAHTAFSLRQVSRMPAATEVVATIRTLMPDVGTIDGTFGGCA